MRIQFPAEPPIGHKPRQSNENAFRDGCIVFAVVVIVALAAFAYPHFF